MEKNLRNLADAMKIYEEGIRLFPRVSKLHEDAGVLASSMSQLEKAIDLLSAALELCRTTTQGGEKGVLLALARVQYQRADRNSLTRAIEFYEAARTASGRRGAGNLPAIDHLSMNLAKIRLQHYRGNLVYNFLVSCGFPIVRANLHSQTTLGADIIVQIETPEMMESYGISGNVLVRCIFKSSFALSDLNEMDRMITSDGTDYLISDQIALLVLASIPQDLERRLFQRIEDRNRHGPVVVPLPQEIIEKEQMGVSALHEVMDRWLYRRDLFALNFPVIGRRFFGRERPMAELRDAISSGIPIGIFGLRKVGKTSILKETERRAAETGDIVIYVDLLRIPEDVGDTRWLYWRISNLLHAEVSRHRFIRMRWSLGGTYANFLNIPPEFPVATAFDSDLSLLLGTIDKSRVNPKPKVVLLLDEIERLLPTQLGKPGFVGFFDFFSYLRGVSQETNSFVVMVTGANAAISETSQFGQRDNPVFNFFREIYLQLLEQNECRLMIKTLGRGMGLRFSDTACDLVFRLTGGHPYFCRQLCSFVSLQNRERPLSITESHVKEVTHTYMQLFAHDYREIMDRLERDYPGERKICVRLAEVDSPIPTENLGLNGPGAAMALRHLIGYQIVSIENGRVSLTMELLKNWLRSR